MVRFCWPRPFSGSPAMLFIQWRRGAAAGSSAFMIGRGGTPCRSRMSFKLEAPLAVQGRAGHAGFFPFNKFSGVPLLIKAAREAFADSGSDDARKRVMVVPQCHVTRLRLVPDGGSWRVAGVQTNQGEIAVPANGKVVVALGTLES